MADETSNMEGGGKKRDFTSDTLIAPRVPCRMQIIPYPELEKTFETGELLGEGGFGVVWEVEWKGKPVAVKKLNMTRKNAIAGDFIREVSHPILLYGHTMGGGHSGPALAGITWLQRGLWMGWG